MKKLPSIFLVGARGSGKSTLGAALAKRFAWDFVDTDAYIQEHAACSIADMVAREGWEYFREQESKALLAVNAEKSIIATGGGMILRDENRSFMQKNGFVCFLSVPATELTARLLADPKQEQRPAFSEATVLEEVHATLKARLPLYESAAHLCVDACLPTADVVEDIYARYAEFIKKIDN